MAMPRYSTLENRSDRGDQRSWRSRSGRLEGGHKLPSCTLAARFENGHVLFQRLNPLLKSFCTEIHDEEP